ncbi:MAG TPA: APC family permease [Terriglobales bacterium]|nr:APC family permease [Terriglobales bacterium]
MPITEKKAAKPKRSLVDVLFGRPLSSDEDTKEQVGPAAGVPIFGLDALSSAAYGPEAALTILLPLGVAGAAYILPISVTIIVLLSIVYFSYRQTITAYPGGGGSYIVASANLGAHAGLVAGGALMLDYVLNVAVGISAGVGAVVSAVPSLQPHTLVLCLGVLAVLTVVNLRGVREAGAIFMVPTYVFVACLGATLVMGVVRSILHGGHPLPVAPVPRPAAALTAVSAWLVLKSFASGCTAMTGVEAVSNGVQAFREPRDKNARATLTIIIAVLLLLLAGIAYLCKAYGIAATPPGQAGYQSVLSQLTSAVVGRGVFYFITMVAILSVLALSANTSFADFPRLCRSIAQDRYLPDFFTIRGRRLVFSFGVYTLAIFAAILLLVFHGVTDRLIPLFAVGAFTAFTLSQSGMVLHWRKNRRRGSGASMLINGVGALATGLTTLVVVVAKFTDGAWITVLAIPALVVLMSAVHRHYERMRRETECRGPASFVDIVAPVVVVPLQNWSKVGEKALRFAYTLSQELIVLHVVPEELPTRPQARRKRRDTKTEIQDGLTNFWDEYIRKPATQAKLKPPELVVVKSPYRVVITPIHEYVLELERKSPNRWIAVLVPELIERRWYYYLLHNQRAAALKLLLYAKGDRRIIVVNVPWYLRSK